MTKRAPWVPSIDDSDIAWVRNAMELREFDAPRKDFLRAQSSVDVSACPGSGKTTLIVAKLAVLARKWPHRSRGICVLSHTNAAREEIQRRLRGTVIGSQLLSYPHFIDTIHGFVNRFLAVPWLNSANIHITAIDDDATTRYRRHILGETEYRKLDFFLGSKNTSLGQLRLKDRNWNVRLANGRPFPAGAHTESYGRAMRAVRESAEAGYFCYDEMFIWAKALLEDSLGVARSLQRRFPLVIIDEMQDTSRLQLDILESVFPRGSSEFVLQRVGDPNQAIYQEDEVLDHPDGSFPNDTNHLCIPNSFRFGPAIASLASPFAVHPVGQDGLQGVGPRRVEGDPKPCTHALMLFHNSEASGVLAAYGQHVLSSFDDGALAGGLVTAVGARHQSASEVTTDHSHFPKTVPHYWSGYSAQVGRSDPHPPTLVQYVRVAQALVREGGGLSDGVEKIACGLVRLARRMGGRGLLGQRGSRHRSLVEILASTAEAAAAYRRFLLAYLVDWEPLSAESWDERKSDILKVVAALGGSTGAAVSRDTFLSWEQDDQASLEVSAGSFPQGMTRNVYRVDNAAGRSLDIRLGSVHGVKGQTHLATLLLSTYWYGHSTRKILPWLLGDKANLSGAGPRDQKRLRQTYVAMTRPSHLLCLAIPLSVLGDSAAAREDKLCVLRKRGWSLAEVKGGRPNWV